MLRLQRPRWLGACAVAVALTVVVLLLRLLHPRPSHATFNTWFAKPNGTGSVCTQGSPCSLANALSKARSGDTVALARGTYVGSDPAVMRITTDLIVVGGWDGAADGVPVFDPWGNATILDGQSRRRVVEVSPGTTVELDGLHVINGRRADEGAGVFAQNANLTLFALQVYSNAVYSTGTAEVHGGGAAVRGGSLHVAQSGFYSNTASCLQCLTRGGGLWVKEAITTSIELAEFRSNDASAGAGLYVGSSFFLPLFVDTVWFHDNGRGLASRDAQPCQYGGGMALFRMNAQVIRSTFMGNKAAIRGGGLDASGFLGMDRCWVVNNTADTGAGLAIAGTSGFTVTNCFLVDNEPTAAGGGGCVTVDEQSSGRLLHNTIARNISASPYYGVAAVGNSTLLMQDNIVAYQSVGVWVEGGSTATLAATLLGAGVWANGDDFGGGGTLERVAPEIHADPGFLHADWGDFHLAPGSAAIDAGGFAKLEEDYDGDARPQGNGYDIGADEYVGAQPTPTPTASPTAPAPAVPGLYLCDGVLNPGEIRRVNPATGAEDLVYRSQHGLLTAFSLTDYARRLYFLSASEFFIVTANNVGGVWQPEQTLYTHSTYVRDLAVVMGPDGSPVTYFSEANGSSGKIYRLAQGSVSLYYEVRQQDVAAWSGQFCFGDAGDLYLSMGAFTRARLYRVRGGRVEEIYREPASPIMGMCYASGAIYYADNHQHIYRLELATMTRTLVHTSATTTRLSDVELFGRWVYLPVIRRGS